MEVKSLKHNFMMYSLRTFLNLGFGIIIFPVVAKKIGVKNLGNIQYAEAIVAYFLLFINLGIENYGKREVARYRENKEKLSSLVSELTFILLITTIIGAILFWFYFNFFVQDTMLKKILLIFSLNIALNFLNLEWFYMGIEDQAYVTKRNLFFKIISGILILVFIKSKKDIYVYVSILVFSTVGANILNLYNLKGVINLKKVQIIKIIKHFKPLFILFFSTLALSISYNLDSVMIKSIKNSTELGYYSFAMKFGKLPLVFSTAIVAIFYPRLCNLLGQNKKNEYYKLATLGIELILVFSFPISIGMFILSEVIVKLFGGEIFIPSISIMKVFSIFILIMGIALCTGSMTLVANKKDKEYLLSVVTGSILNFIFNLIFISKIGALGAAIATIITEITAIVIRIILCKEIFKNFKIFSINLLKIVIASIFMGVIIFYTKNIFLNLLFSLFFNIIIGAISYCLLLIFFREKNIFLVINIIKKYLK